VSCGALLAASVAVGLSSCADDVSHDKPRSELNFSEESAAEAGLYGVEQREQSDSPAAADDTGYTSYGTVRDSTGAISFEAPTEWADTDGEIDPEGFNQAEAHASPNLEEFWAGWTVPGVSVRVSKSLGRDVAAALDPVFVLPSVIAAVLPTDVLDECGNPTTWPIKVHGLNVVGVNVFEEHLSDLLYVGFAYQYANCGGNGTELIEIVGYSYEGRAVLHVELQNVTQADVAANLRVLSSLNVNWATVPEPTAEQLASDRVLP
jgi:hypothetical protein